MRELKFRAWDDLSRVMLDNDHLWEFTYGDIFPDTPDQRAFNLMQYTGIKDKNGVEIYEGDVVRVKDEDSEWMISQVFYQADSDYPAFDLNYKIQETIESNAISYYKIYGEIEVIGNIHQNPELLNAQ